jgi:hypothetical protein
MATKRPKLIIPAPPAWLFQAIVVLVLGYIVWLMTMTFAGLM